MSKILRAALSAVVGVVGLAACDSAPPPEATVSPPVESVESEAEPAGDSIAAAVRDEDYYARARRLGALLPTLGPEAVPEVKQVLGDLTLDLGGMEHELLLRFWATYEPAEASRWAVVEAFAGYRFPAVIAALTRWAEVDPKAALSASQQWIAERRDETGAIRTALVRGWFAASPSELAENLKAIDQGVFGNQRALATYIHVMLQKKGIQATAQWVESLPDDAATYKLSAFRQLAAALPQFDTEAAVRWCEAQCDGPYGGNLRNMIARRWVMMDGPAALAWLSTAPEGFERDLAVRVAFSLWGGADRDAALSWMASQTASGEAPPWLRPAYPLYARFLAKDSPLEAIRWAEQIENPNGREWTLIRIARTWRQVDPAAADAWLRESPLSEEARAMARGQPQPAASPPEEPLPSS